MIVPKFSSLAALFALTVGVGTAQVADSIGAKLVPMIIASAFGAFLAWIAALYWLRRKARADMSERITSIEKQLALVGQAVLPISTAFQAILIKELTHFHAPELDELLTKIGPPSTMTPEEEARFAVLLKERTRDLGDQITDSERGAALILPTIIKRAKAEAAILETVPAIPVAFKLVTVPPPTTEEKPAP